MLFDDKAKAKIAKAFYDKTIEVLDATENVDAEGGIVKNYKTVKSTFKGNIRFNALGELQTELGLTQNIDVAISCPTNTEVEVGDLVRYSSVTYLVTDSLPRDSHKYIMGAKWRAD